MGSRTRLRTAVRREQIARAAVDLVAARGVRRLSVVAVARRVGVVPSALYRHYGDKESILDAALQLVTDQLQANVATALAGAADPLARLALLFERHIALIRENQGLPRIVFAEDFYAEQPHRRRRVYQAIRGYLLQVADLVRQGQQAGQIAPEVTPDAAARLFLGLVQPAAILWSMSDGHFDVTQHSHQAWPLFLRALGANPRAARRTRSRPQPGGAP